METNSIQTPNFWRTIGKNLQLVFEQGAPQTTSHEDLENKNYQNFNIKQNHQEQQLQQDQMCLLSQGPSRQIIQFEQNQIQPKRIEATIKQECFISDQANGVYLTTSRNSIPQITINILPNQQSQQTNQQKSQQSTLVVQVMLCEKSSCPQRQKFKVIKGALNGCSRKKVNAQKNKIQFKGLKFNYNSNPDKNSRLLIALYKKNKQHIRTYLHILVSNDLFLIQDSKVIMIDTYQSLFPYFENFGVQFMQRPPSNAKINKNDKHYYHQQISNFEKYLTKKQKSLKYNIFSIQIPTFYLVIFQK